ncbi:cytochrome c3 family protein [Qipengyuania sp. DGS5-3]|uniref:cytochrome c3 family protein n=1 Tax=Qipengyuania sp. DGS5-3 TaxID=3349632 RepID=UPI0036D3F58D
MAFLLRTIDYTASGREIVRERNAYGTTLSIGRATSNDIVIPDLAVEQEHARIEADGNAVRVSSIGTLGFQHEGRTTTDTSFDPAGGGELTFGTYRLQFAREGDGGPVAITIQQQQEAEDTRDAVRGFDLASAMPSKRTMAWISLSVILLAFLAVPIWSHLTRDKLVPDADREGQVAMDASWSTGALSTAHHGLEDNCEACHVNAFEAVRDDTCLTCHEGLGDHAEIPRQLTGRGPMSTGDELQWAVATTLGKEGPGSCTTCHSEHEGAGKMEPASQKFCAECHDTMDTRLTDTKLENAGDFGDHHPQFMALIYTELGQEKPERISLDGNPREEHGLKFPHDLHMSGTGGVARMANSLSQYGDGLECSDCHTLPETRVDFEPVNMEENCEACHSLVYDKVGSTFRSLRHGDVDEMRADLAAMDRAPRRAITAGRSRPGEFAQGRRYYQNFGRPQRNYIAINQALSKDGVCGECHMPTTTNGRPDVVPVNLRPFYFQTGRFNHQAHEQETCVSCHAAETSKSANDLLLPKLDSCRECHQGEQAVEAEVPSSCAMCHSYHPPTGRLPEDHPTDTAKQVARISRVER